MRKLSVNGLNFIKSFEGCHLTTYDDLQPKLKLTPNSLIKGTLTIGWGHTGTDVKIGQTITQQQADYLLMHDLEKYIAYVNNEAFVPMTKRLNQNQFDALVSFCYNCGPSNLKKLCYNYSISDIPKNIILYNKSKGQVLMGLVRRRNSEKELFLKGIEEIPLKEVNNMDKEKLEQLQKKIDNMEHTIFNLIETVKDVPCPIWLKQEFPDVLDYINTERGSHEFWRGVLVAYRLTKK